ncbi:hypothetical protein C2G38_2217854 [Gigaspora rosea]|uniref:Uncharacterized protein n=1 Tax=Gigaspora rosea TaxID=44941 RepID=A0A397U795_9GLOM|nr:hypothetical protein C2G38_2217854 [Gigaspora rosea]
MTKDTEFAEDDYESIIINLDSLIKYIDRSTIQKVWHVITIEQNKEHFVVICKDDNHLCIYEAAISIINKKNLLDSNEPVYEHQIAMNYSFLNEIWQTQIILDTVKQNMNRQVKYNQGFGYAKKAVKLALETGLENELNKLLQNWIKEMEKKFIVIK